ncbi:MAG: DUF4268 domain-containing protein [Paludibacteraceae bacterium]|nr:DUF4268 domain-containing protein [Paludibacteraceae bacterium]
MEIGKIQLVNNIRDVWPKEDANFTPWLCENIDVLNQCIGIELKEPQNEVGTGNYFVDITAKDDEGSVAIIENQFSKSDHDHLGKIITYISALKAKIAVWIVENASMEHISAINNLNENFAECSFYLVKVQAIRINGSAPAALFTMIVGPDETTESVKHYNKENAEKEAKNQSFWNRFIEECKSRKFGLFANHKAPKGVYIASVSGCTGVYYQCWAFKNSVRIEVKFFRKDQQENSELLKKLEAHKADIESVYGSGLMWVDNENERMCSIREDRTGGGVDSDETEMCETINWCIDKLSLLELATKKYMKFL